MNIDIRAQTKYYEPKSSNIEKVYYIMAKE